MICINMYHRTHLAEGKSQTKYWTDIKTENDTTCVMDVTQDYMGRLYTF